MFVRTTKLYIFFFSLGLALFAYLVYRVGVDEITAHILKAGWSFLYIILLWLFIYLLNTLAWRLVMSDRADGISFSRLFMVTVSGFTINTLTPGLMIGGEPYKVVALTNTFGSQHSLSAVVLYRMINLLGHMLLLLTGLLTAILFLPLSSGVLSFAIVIGVAIMFIIQVTLSGHRDGVFERLMNVVRSMKFLHRALDRLEKNKSSWKMMDEVITSTYRNQRSKFFLSVLLEYVTRIATGFEVYLILHGVGVEITPAAALLIYVAYSIIINIMFVIPMNLGVREGGLYLGLETLALPPVLGIYLGVVIRIREIFWILIGLLFILITSKLRDKVVSVPESARI